MNEQIELTQSETAVHQTAKNTGFWATLREAFAGYQGPDDGVSACLYSDYRTVSSFYFSRLALARLDLVLGQLPHQFVEHVAVLEGRRLSLGGIDFRWFCQFIASNSSGCNSSAEALLRIARDCGNSYETEECCNAGHYTTVTTRDASIGSKIIRAS